MRYDLLDLITIRFSFDVGNAVAGEHKRLSEWNGFESLPPPPRLENSIRNRTFSVCDVMLRASFRYT